MNNEELRDFVERLADRAEVDWTLAERRLGPTRLRGLRRVESIVSAYRRIDAPSAAPRFQHLHLQNRLGGGFDGEVWRAWDSVLERTVALKLRGEAAGLQAPLLEEARALARINHSNVLRVLGAGVADHRIGIWSEFVDGEDLDARARRDGRLGADEVRVIGMTLCAALAAIHRAGFVHGDVKPANVLRTVEGRYLLCDLGSAVPLRDRVAVRPLASGSLLYLAPEVLGGSAPGVTSDVYALGTTLFHLLTGTVPVDGDRVETLLAAHAQGQRRRLRDLRPDLPAALVAAIERALEARPEARHASAGAFESALAAWPARSPFAVLAGAAAAATLALVIGAVAWFVTRAAPPLVRAVAWHRGDATAAPLLDGAFVRRGDTFRLDLDCSRTCWAYVFSEDGSREVTPLFPLAGTLANPLRGAQRLPGNADGSERHWRFGEARGGQERVLLLIAPASFDPPTTAADGERPRFRSIDAIVAPTHAADDRLDAIAASALARQPETLAFHLLLRRSDADATHNEGAARPR